MQCQYYQACTQNSQESIPHLKIFNYYTTIINNNNNYHFPYVGLQEGTNQDPV